MATHSSILAWRILMDRGSWWPTVHRVAKNWTRLKDVASFFFSINIRICNIKIRTVHPCSTSAPSVAFRQSTAEDEGAMASSRGRVGRCLIGCMYGCSEATSYSGICGLICHAMHLDKWISNNTTGLGGKGLWRWPRSPQ